MIYPRPTLKYTDMAQWVDEHAYDEDCDVNKLYEYLYQLVFMLASVGKYFHREEYYEDFAVRGATTAYMRLHNKRQFQFNEDGTPKLGKVVSILNYLKAMLPNLKIDFQQEAFTKTALKGEDDVIFYDTFDTFDNALCNEIDEMYTIDFVVYLHDIEKTIRKFLSNIPRKRTDPEWSNIYLSCLLTLLSQVTLSEKERKHLSGLTRCSKDTILNTLREHRDDDVVLYHLPKEMKNYIRILVKRIRHIICVDLQAVSDGAYQQESVMRNLALSFDTLEGEE